MKFIKRLLIWATVLITSAGANHVTDNPVIIESTIPTTAYIETFENTTIPTEATVEVVDDMITFITPENNTDPYDSKESYYGNWTDYTEGTSYGITTMEVTEDGEYLRICVNCCFDAGKRLIWTWEMVGEYDYSENAVYYWDGVCKDVVSNDDGTMQEFIRYTNGNGILVFRDGIMHWHEAVEQSGDMCQFVKCK